MSSVSISEINVVASSFNTLDMYPVLISNLLSIFLKIYGKVFLIWRIALADFVMIIISRFDTNNATHSLDCVFID